MELGFLPDGMVPHIIFHVEDDSYFPGPAIWQTGRPTPTSDITRPPILAYAMRRLFDEAKDKRLASDKARVPAKGCRLASLVLQPS